jgi:hypothetical protein
MFHHFPEAPAGSSHFSASFHQISMKFRLFPETGMIDLGNKFCGHEAIRSENLISPHPGFSKK